MQEYFWDKGVGVRKMSFPRKREHGSYKFSTSMGSLNVCSYNIHGFRQGDLFLKNNLQNYDICLIQKHWLYPSTIIEFAGINVNYDYQAISQMDGS